jgi:hypothetical protein
MGQTGTAQGTSQWYLITRRGEVVRVRHGMRLGETAAGELSFDPSCAQLEMETAEDGGLVLCAVDDYELESPAGTRQRCERLTRSWCADIRLAHNIVQLQPEGFDPTRVTKTVELRVVRSNDEVAEPQIGRISGGSRNSIAALSFCDTPGVDRMLASSSHPAPRRAETFGDPRSGCTPSDQIRRTGRLVKLARRQADWRPPSGVRGPLIAC